MALDLLSLIQWWNNTDVVNDERACFFDDEFTFAADGTLTIDQQGETWIEGCRVPMRAPISWCPVAPHDGTGEFTWEHDSDANELVLMGQGAYIGLPMVTNAGETQSPSRHLPLLPTTSMTMKMARPRSPSKLRIAVPGGSTRWLRWLSFLEDHH